MKIENLPLHRIKLFLRENNTHYRVFRNPCFSLMLGLLCRTVPKTLTESEYDSMQLLLVWVCEGEGAWSVYVNPSKGLVTFLGFVRRTDYIHGLTGVVIWPLDGIHLNHSWHTFHHCHPPSISLRMSQDGDAWLAEDFYLNFHLFLHFQPSFFQTSFAVWPNR